eukprot:5165627-Prymnesium_polylepis.3
MSEVAGPCAVLRRNCRPFPHPSQRCTPIPTQCIGHEGADQEQTHNPLPRLGHAPSTASSVSACSMSDPLAETPRLALASRMTAVRGNAGGASFRPRVEAIRCVFCQRLSCGAAAAAARLSSTA